jgi:hypothetical protein
VCKFTHYLLIGKENKEKFGSKGKKTIFVLAIGGGAADYFNPKLAAVQLRGAFSLIGRCHLLTF